VAFNISLIVMLLGRGINIAGQSPEYPPESMWILRISIAMGLGFGSNRSQLFWFFRPFTVVIREIASASGQLILSVSEAVYSRISNHLRCNLQHY